MEKVFSDRLRQLRAQKGVKRTQMSVDLHMSESYIYNIEAGFAYPSMAQFFGICAYFGITPAEFMQFEPETTSKQEELLAAVEGFDNEKMDQVIRFAKEI